MPLPPKPEERIWKNSRNLTLFSNNNKKSILYCLVKLPILVTDKTVVIPSAHLAGASVRTIQKATQEHITITNKGV